MAIVSELMSEGQFVFSADAKRLKMRNRGRLLAFAVQILFTIPALILLIPFSHFVLRSILNFSPITFGLILAFCLLLMFVGLWQQWRQTQQPTQQTLTLADQSLIIKRDKTVSIGYNKIHRVVVQRNKQGAISGLTIFAYPRHIESLAHFGEQESIYKILVEKMPVDVQTTDFGIGASKLIGWFMIASAIMILLSFIITFGLLGWLFFVAR